MSPTSRRCWVRLNNAPKGPFTIDDIRGIADIGPDTLACPEGARGGDQWRPVCEIPELAEARGIPLQAPASTESTHLGILVKEGFVRATRMGQAVAYALDEAGFHLVEQLLRSLTDT